MENIAHQNRVGSPGLSVPDEKCEVQQPDLHKVHDESFQKWNQPAAWQNDQSSTQRSLPAVMSNLHLSAKDQDVFNKLTNRNSWSCFTLLLDQNFTHWHQTSLFYSQKSLLVLNVDQEIKHHSKTQESDVLEGDNRFTSYVFIYFYILHIFTLFVIISLLCLLSFCLLFVYIFSSCLYMCLYMSS